jgi:site-specific DNA recombinase
MSQIANAALATKVVRCAIYTRKSTEEGLEKAFNTLDAQRATAEAHIASQQQEGWRCLPEHYDDGGFTGSHLERPALQRLLEAIAAAQVDCVLVQRVDRLSRSLLDFARLMELFEKHQVAFVSVTQMFSTATSVGRLILNVLLSFAQFERELIAERTRDKIAAARRNGKWVGGLPLLGYDVDAKGAKLRVNEAEAVRVRAIFALFLEHQTLRSVLRELDQRGWRTIRWRTRKGHERGGRRFTRNHLRQLLSNVTYIGQIRYRNEVHPGEHPALIDPTTFAQVQALLRRNRQQGSLQLGQAALLQGILYCRQCGAAMIARAAPEGAPQARCYVCADNRLPGQPQCSAPPIPARPIERLVLQHLQRLDPAPEHSPAAWVSLTPQQQIDSVQRLVARVDYDAPHHKIAIALHSEDTSS